MAHFLFHLNRWPTSIQLLLLASLSSSSLTPSLSVSFSPLVHSNLCHLLIRPMRLRSLSNSIAVDLMATEKIEDTDNPTCYATDAVSFGRVSCNDSSKLEMNQENVSLFVRSAEKKWLQLCYHAHLSVFSACVLFYSCFVVQPSCTDTDSVLTIHMFFSPSLRTKTRPHSGWKTFFTSCWLEIWRKL